MKTFKQTKMRKLLVFFVGILLLFALLCICFAHSQSASAETNTETVNYGNESDLNNEVSTRGDRKSTRLNSSHM